MDPYKLVDGVVQFEPLRYVGARGAVRSWTAHVRLLDAGGAPLPVTPAILTRGTKLPAGLVGEIRVLSMQEGGKLRDSAPTLVRSGKNLGRSNETNVLTQAVRDALGKYNAQKGRYSADRAADDAGPAGSADPADGLADGLANAMLEPMERVFAAPGLLRPVRPPPMLARPLKDAPITAADFAAGLLVQPKLNGVRLVAYIDHANHVVLYSRQCKPYAGKLHIRDEVAVLLNAAREYLDGPCARAYLDGELYLHDKPLNFISGQARNSQDDASLEYHVFDIFFPDAAALGTQDSAAGRQQILAMLVDTCESHLKNVKLVKTTDIRDQKGLDDFVQAKLAEGYEGAVARRASAPYRYSDLGYHSADMIKLKPRFDDEFPIIGFEQGIGKDLGAVKLKCRTKLGEEFGVVPNMTLDDRKKLYASFVTHGMPPGLVMTVSYAELSAKTGKPLQAKGIAIRSYEGGPDNDPIARILAA